jgi:plastocyanin
VKYISYFFMAIASAFLVILLSLSSCSPNPEPTTAQPLVSTTQSQTPTNQTPGSPHTAKTTVKIQKFKFAPVNMALAVGETVQFINLDEEPHTATSTDGAFNSKALDTNQTWNYTATKPGTFPYVCSIHPFMKGTLTVKPKKN